MRYLLIVLVLLSFTACVKNQEDVSIVAFLPLSGTTAYYGEISAQGISLAEEELERKYDVDIIVDYKDSKFLAKEAVSEYYTVNEPDGIITGASQVSMALKPLADADEVVQMGIFTSTSKYASPNDLSYRISTSPLPELSLLLEELREKEYSEVVVIYLQNDFGQNFFEVFLENSKGINVEGYGHSFGEKDFRGILEKAKEADAIVFFGVSVHFGEILEQAKEERIETNFYAIRSAEDPQLLKFDDEAIEGLIYTYPFDIDKNTDFVLHFKAKYGRDPDAYAAEAYEGMKFLAEALIVCGEDRECVQEYFSLVDEESLFGNIFFDENGDVYYDFFLKEVRNGEFKKYDG